MKQDLEKKRTGEWGDADEVTFDLRGGASFHCGGKGRLDGDVGIWSLFFFFQVFFSSQNSSSDDDAGLRNPSGQRRKVSKFPLGWEEERGKEKLKKLFFRV